jgi:Tfp pilus assembly protein PilF
MPDDPNLILDQLVLSLTVGDTIAVKKLTEKGIYLMKSLPMSEASIASISAFAYSKVASLDNAEEYYRRALSLEPENPVRLNDLAYFLIDKELDINEGLKLVDKALELKPDYYNYLHTKGWGLYRQGKYQEALGILQKSWDLRRKKAIYDLKHIFILKQQKRLLQARIIISLNCLFCQLNQKDCTGSDMLVVSCSNGKV